MPVLPPLKQMFDAMNSADMVDPSKPIAETRAMMDAMVEQSFTQLQMPPAALADEKDVQIPVAGGEITVRIYRAGPSDKPQACHLFFHGGGFWMGTLAQGDAAGRAIANGAECIVVSVDYRLAPEYKFPTAAEDAYAALLWVAENCAEQGIDPSKISVGGGSAGGNLAAAVSLMARDRSGPKIVLQVLEIPVTDLSSDEALEFPDEDLVVSSGKTHYGGLYLASSDDARNPYASPLLADDLSNLPPALIMTAEYDPLQPEGEKYAQRLQQAGVEVEYRCWEGQFHGSQWLSALIPEEASEYQQQIISSLRKHYSL
jgi:acetyl esterase